MDGYWYWFYEAENNMNCTECIHVLKTRQTFMNTETICTTHVSVFMNNKNVTRDLMPTSDDLCYRHMLISIQKKSVIPSSRSMVCCRNCIFCLSLSPGPERHEGEVNVLLVGSGDPRHILKTIADLPDKDSLHVSLCNVKLWCDPWQSQQIVIL